MIISNYPSLATTQEREDAIKITNAGIQAVLTGPAMKAAIKLSANKLKVQSKTYDLKKFKRIFVVGAGKAAADMAQAAEEILGDRLTGGIVIDTRTRQLSKIQVKLGTHPLTSQGNLDATQEIMKILDDAEETDLVIALISGGGSALMESPQISLDQLISTNKFLLKSGADIHEINAVRKHLSKIKGGRMAELCYPATLITLIVSDVMGNNLDVIASGPTVMDKTTIKDAQKIAKKYGLPSVPFTESPKDKKVFSKTHNFLIVTNVLAAEAMKKKAKSLGYTPKILSTQQTGEARAIGKMLAQKIKPGTALIATGETTVVVKGTGKGGRNQELALSASKYFKQPGVVLSCGSDGIDFIEDAAGGIVDENTVKEAKAKNLNVDAYLDNNDSYNILSQLNCILVTGKTGTNVGDLMLALGAKARKKR
jgi:glycerate 2-kinase